MSADSEKPNIMGVIGRNIALWQNLWVGVGRFVRSAAGSINSGRHILESRCAERCANDEFLTSFRATLIPKTIGNRKRDCAGDCGRGINTTWENLEIEKHKSVRWAERTPSWFVLFDLQIFSGGVYPPELNLTHNLFFYSRTCPCDHLTVFPIVFGINLIHFYDEKRTVQPEIRSLLSVRRSPVTPFDRAKRIKDANCLEECSVFGNGKSELSARGEKKVQKIIF